jgi:alginate O-acetyltransferase complex protein AlgJ
MKTTHYRNRFSAWLGLTLVLFMTLPVLNLYHKEIALEDVQVIEDLFQADVLEQYKNSLLYELGFSGNKGKVLVGKNRWLFLGDDYENGMARGRGIRNVSPSRITEWVGSMKARQSWLAEKGIGLVFVVAPNKHSVYPEYLPEGVTIANPNSTDRLVRAMEQAGLRTIDPRKLLALEKLRHEYLYSETDTHWSGLGAYLVYEAIMDEIVKESSGFDQAIQIPKSDFQPKRVTPKGLARLLKIDRYLNPRADHGYSNPPHPGSNDELCLEVFTSYSIPRVDCEASKNRALPVFSTKYVVRNQRGLNKGTVLIVRDSFSNAMSTLLNSTFERSVQVHHRHTINAVNFKKIIHMEPPKVVIYIVAERSLFSRSFNSFK